MKKCIPVKQYNRQQEVKYHEACQKWDYRTGGFPQIAFYLFFTNQGNERLTGYIAYDEEKHRACWGKTKKEAINYLNK